MKLFFKTKLNLLRYMSLIFIYMGVFFSSSSHADVLTPYKLKNINGESTQSISVLSVQDQASDDDDWENYVDLLIDDDDGYKGTFIFKAPANTSSLDKMVLHANYRGEEKQWQRWVFKIFDAQAKKWVYIADNTGAQSWKWKSIVKSVGENPKRFINHKNKIKVRFLSKGTEDHSQLDYLTLKTTSSETTAKPPVPAEPVQVAEPVQIAVPPVPAEPVQVAEPVQIAVPPVPAEPVQVAEPVQIAEPPVLPAEPVQVAEPVQDHNPTVKRITLEDVKHWTYNIQDVNTDRQMEALIGSHFDMYVLEPTRSEKGLDFNMKKLIKDIRDYNIKHYNKDPIILAYLDIGEAENWRWYFESNWRIGNPSWIVADDPNGWEGNYPVAYWNQTWHNIVYNGHKGTSMIKQTLEDDFDGVYMDWVEAFSDDNVVSAASKDGVNPANEMFRLIEGIKSYARKTKPDYLVVAQNAPDLFQENPSRYIKAIDAIAEEAVWFEGSGGFDVWGEKSGYNVITNSMYPGWTETSLGHLINIKKHMPVFVVEYAQDLDGKNYASKVYNELAPKYGFIPYCTQRSLQRLSTQPYPKGYSADY